MAVMRCPHTDPERGRCIMTPHETFTESTHVYDGSPEHLASPLAPLLSRPDDMATRVIDLMEARTGVRVLPWQREVLRVQYDYGNPHRQGKGHEVTQTVIDEFDGDPDDTPWRSLWTVVGWLAGAGLALAALVALLRRLDRGNTGS